MEKDIFIMLKIKNSEEKIIKHIKNSYDKKLERSYYATKDIDKETISELKEIDKYSNFKMLVIIFDEDEKKKRIAEELYLCDIDTSLESEANQIKYISYGHIKSQLIIDNYINKSWIDLSDDFEEHSYLSMHKSNGLIEELSVPFRKKYSLFSDDSLVYRVIDEEDDFDRLSQKNHYCKRVVGASKPSKDRSEFQRDRERIVHSKASRRLVDKAQIFTSSKGDHFRTRMTHTLEVSQIARGLSLRLNLNHDLTEAIALAHDIGHTPFGHQGERTLKEILSGKIDIIKSDDTDIKYGGFKHNFQGVRVLSHLEEKYLEHEGLDLSYQVLEGVFKHTGGRRKKCSECSHDICKNDCIDINEFLTIGDIDHLYMEHDFPTTLEGQIVKIADEIAQRGHDLDDAFASKHLGLDELRNYSEIKKMAPIKKILEDADEKLKELKSKGRIFIDENDMLRSRIVPGIIAYFIDDVTSESEKRMSDYDVENDFFKEHKRIDKELIRFSREGHFILNYLETIISNKVINSSEVSKFDDKAQMIISGLFKAYYNNPKLLPSAILKHIYKDYISHDLPAISFVLGNSGLIRKEFAKICSSDLSKLLGEEMDEYSLKRKLLVRNITDYISSMTDNYAINEYRGIYENK